jgi:CheY-like chemotaxis protein
MNGKEAMQMAQSARYDAILMDIQMPVMDGKEATRQLRNQGNQVPVIACSAHALSSEKAECLALGMNDYLTKPFEEKDLLKLLNSYFIKSNSQLTMENQGDQIEEILAKIRADVGPDFVAIIIQKFNSDMPVLAEDLLKHLEEMDFKTIQEKTHRLAGTMATFRFPEGLRLARLAEYAARDQKTEETRAGVQDLIGYLKHTLEQLAGIA